jgi:hypothetical protein
LSELGEVDTPAPEEPAWRNTTKKSPEDSGLFFGKPRRDLRKIDEGNFNRPRRPCNQTVHLFSLIITEEEEVLLQTDRQTDTRSAEER